MFKLQNKIIGDGFSPLTIANIERTKIFKSEIDEVSDIGFDAINLHYIRASDMAIENSAQYQMLKEQEISDSDFKKLIDYSKSKKLITICTAYDTQSMDFLNSLDIDAFKILSFEIDNFELLRELKKIGKPIFMSTGMATFGEVLVARGYLDTNKLVILYCSSEHQTKPENLHMNQMIIQYKNRLPEYNIGFSDKSVGIAASIAAVVSGAVVIEKNMDNQTNRNLKILIESIKSVEKFLYAGEAFDEKAIIEHILKRRSIVSAMDIACDTIIARNMLLTKRPGDGINPRFEPNLMGLKTKTNIKKNRTVQISDIEIPKLLEEAIIRWNSIIK